MSQGSPLKSAASTRAMFDDLWRQVQSDLSKTPFIKLRDTANLIGLCLFPVGWNWHEYASTSFQPPMDYELKIATKRMLDTNEHDGPTEKGAIARLNGQAFRMIEAEEFLHQLIVRDLIPVRLHSDRGAKLLDDRLRFEDGLDFDVVKNLIYVDDPSLGWYWEFSTDPKALIKELNEALAWKTKGQWDWLRIELFLRNKFEIFGLPKVQDTYVNATVEWCASLDGGKEPALSTTREIASRLMCEYSFSEN
jgi:hypothetical protein